jgi:hypothetical protein
MSPWADGTTTPRTAPQLEERLRGYTEALTGAAVAPDGFTNAAVTAAISSLGDDGGVVRLHPGTYTFTAGVTVPRGVYIVGAGAAATVIDHNGNDAAFLCRDGDPFTVYPNRAVTGLLIDGNSGSGAIGVDVGNSWGQRLADLVILNYSAGRAVRLYNSAYWTEGCDLENLMLRGNAVGIEFLRGAGTESFAYQRWRNVAIQVPANGVGVDFGGASTETVYVYNSDFDLTVWLEGDDAVAVRVQDVAAVGDSRFNVTGEQSGSHTGRLGIENLGGNLVGYGRVAINSAANDLSAGVTTIRPYPKVIDSGVTDDGVNYRQAFTSNPDNRHSGQVGVGVGTGIDLVYVAGYGGGSGDVFRVLAVPFEGDPSTASTVFTVSSTGAVILDSGVIVVSGSGAPTFDAPVGSLYLRTDGSTSTTLYVKTAAGSGGGNWTAK